MFDTLIALLAQYNLRPDVVVMVGAAVASLLLFIAVATTLTRRNPAAIRLAAASARENRRDRGLLRETVRTPRGLMKTIMPSDGKDRTALELKMVQAGFFHPSAMRYYMLARVAFGVGMPLVFVMLLAASHTPGVYFPYVERIAALDRSETLRILVILVAGGYFLPSSWLDSRLKERRLKLTESFPNALDLLQVSVEAGMGFDAAMTRVGNELLDVSPDIATEFLNVQLQMQAGRPRDAALQDMAQRTGIEVVRSFASVVQQSMRFGTPMSEALTAYAAEMRLYREMAAQEMANKLPVKMSGVLASLMLPALILCVLGPIVIRYMNMGAPQ